MFCDVGGVCAASAYDLGMGGGAGLVAEDEDPEFTSVMISCCCSKYESVLSCNVFIQFSQSLCVCSSS